MQLHSAYASKLARELMQRDKRTDASWLLKVSDERRPVVFAIPVFCSLRLRHVA